MTLTTAVLNWLATNAGVNNCFSPTGVSYRVWNQITQTFDTYVLGTGDVVSAFWASHQVNRDTDVIIAGMDYIGFKALNGEVDIDIVDIGFVYNNDGSGTLPAYCSPANVISAILTVDKNDCVTPCTVNGTVSWTNTGGSPSSPIDLNITVNGTPTLIAPAVTINPGETKPYTFSLPDLAAGTYTVQASPNAGTTPKTITVRTPANVISAILTVDKNDCVTPCTVNGTVSWTNTGGTASPPTNLGITVNGTPTPIDSAVTINPGETKSYTFSLPDLAAGTYTVQASPNAGTTPKTITVRTPANIVSESLILSTNLCTEPCNVTGSVSWINNGGTIGTFDPAILINMTPVSLGPTETIGPGQTITHGFSLPPDLMADTYNVCASPGTHCQTVVVTTPANVISAILTVDKNDCVTPCTVNGTVSWTNTGGTASPPTNLGITVNGTPTPIDSAVTINPGETKSYTFSLPDLAAGTYTVQASPNAGTTPKTITVRAPVASAYFTSVPTGALIYIDGSETSSGVTDFTVQNLSIGPHTYKLTNAICDYDATGEFTTIVGTTVPVPVTFDTSARFESVPVGASIYIDGGTTPSGTTPGVVTGLTPGEHTYTLKKSGYMDLTNTFIAVICKRVNIPANLSKVQEAGMGLLAVALIFGTLLMGKKEEKEKKELKYY